LTAALLAVWLAGCAQPTRVVLLPQDDGSGSAVVVTRKNDKGSARMLSKPYQEATVGHRLQVDQSDAASVRARYGMLLDLRPPTPRRFVLYFDPGGSTLTAASQDELAQALQAVHAYPGADITVTGYTDTVDTQEHNDALSLERAEAVRQILVDAGFPASRIEAVGRGERELVVPTPDQTVEPMNRRVVIEVR
jgi:outer membrane protein OmpA-like peptidoglycan-associated protein